MRKRWNAVLTALLMFCVVSGAFANGSQDSSAASGGSSGIEGRINIGLPDEMGDLSPFGAVTLGRNYLKYNLWENLAIFKEFGQPYDEMDWVLAKNIVAVDGFTTDIEIYDNIYDSEGNHITASDVVYSYEMSAASGFMDKVKTNLKSITALDDYNVRLVLTNDGIGFREYMISYPPIVSQKAFEKYGSEMSTKPVSTAPYKVQEVVAGSHIVIEKNENYWQKDPSKLAYTAIQPMDEFKYYVIKEPSQMSIALETGKIDVAARVDSNEIGRFWNEDGTSKAGYNVDEEYGGLCTIMTFNSNSDYSACGDQDLRQAILYAIDTNAIVQSVLKGKGRAIGTTASPSCDDYNPEWDVDYYNYNLDMAKKKLAEAGYEEGELTLRLITDSEKVHQMAAQIIQAYLIQIGVKVEITSYDNALFSTYRLDPTQFDICIQDKGSSGLVVSVWDLTFNSIGYDHGAAAIFVKDDKLQSLLEKAASAETHTQQNVNAFADYLEEQAYAYGLYVKASFTVGNEKVDDIVCHPFGHFIAGASSYNW